MDKRRIRKLNKYMTPGERQWFASKLAIVADVDKQTKALDAEINRYHAAIARIEKIQHRLSKRAQRNDDRVERIEADAQAILDTIHERNTFAGKKRALKERTGREETGGGR